MKELITSLARHFPNEKALLFRWQDLAGSLIGVFGAIFVTFLGLIVSHYYRRHQEFRESLRMTEVSLALALNDIYDAERHLNDFLERLDLAVMQPLSLLQNPNQYFLNKTNFPQLVVNLDSSLIKARFKSYYIHNKVLILCKNVNHMNRMFVEMKIDYEKIFAHAQFLITQNATQTNQQAEYLSHNQSFIIFVEDVIAQLQIAKKYFAQAKVYNLKLLNKQRVFVWRQEGISFKAFLNKKHIQEYRNTLKSLDRIDKIIEKEVDGLLSEVDNREDGQITTPLSLKDLINLINKKIKSWTQN